MPPHRRRAGSLATGFLTLLAAVQAAAQAPTALWCAPAVGRTALRVAEACGRAVPPEAAARIGRMEQAFRAALERVHGAAVRDEFWRGWDSLTRPAAVARAGCAAALRQWGPLLEALAGPEGLATTERVEAEARVTRDPRLGLCV